MGIFEVVKDNITPLQVARKYLGEPSKRMGKTLWYYSPLRAKERTPSMAVNDNKGFTDFGTGKNYDVISFIQEYYNCNPKQAVEILARDFGINLDIYNENILELLKKQRDEEIKIQNAINSWYNKMYEILTYEFKKWRNMRFTAEWNTKAFQTACKEEQKFEYLVDLFMYADEETKVELYRTRKRFERYEREGIIF